MASDFSFDIVSEVNMPEVNNAVNQALKEISQRYDFKGSNVTIELNDKEKEIKINAEDEYRLKSALDVLESKLVKRQVSLKFLDYGKIEPALGGTVKQVIKLKSGIPREKAKEITETIKQSKLKVQTQILDDKLRVSGKKKDDLQAVIRLLKEKDFGIVLQFTNYR
ncbi:YajQ family cyclic di-GMP-binding protein [Carboxydothermus pertinax]|uniref:Nucleotide-binding protein cpu_18830 n=1 Tax=Carboxydothermus pertinax TaxID=870242 RepID=A0A1L8CWU9_9THEO|nr:YajQ family cyclic di-GMP-binding protein [Carboxydothermus pertinax]GAV23373.1 nucleotide-binding protein [Carboxydothermus pertinax]